MSLEDDIAESEVMAGELTQLYEKCARRHEGGWVMRPLWAGLIVAFLALNRRLLQAQKDIAELKQRTEPAVGDVWSCFDAKGYLEALEVTQVTTTEVAGRVVQQDGAGEWQPIKELGPHWDSQAATRRGTRAALVRRLRGAA